MRKIQTFTNDKLVKKWKDVIDGKGDWEEFGESCPAVDPFQRVTMAQILENTAKSINIKDMEALKNLKESTHADATGDYKSILIPMLRRVIPSQIGPRVLGTWSMTSPEQQIFAIRSHFQNTTDNPVKNTNSNLLTLAADALTSNFVVDGAISTDGTGAGVGVVRHIENSNILVEITSGYFEMGDNVDNVAGYSAAETTVAAVYDNEAQYKFIFTNYTMPYTTSAGENLSTDMKEIGFDIETATISAETIKLKAKWSDELEEDLRAIHQIDAAALLASIATDEIDLELNQLIVSKIRTAAYAGGVSTFNYAGGGNVYDPTGTTNVTVDGRWEFERYQNLMVVIATIQQQIGIANRRGQANFMIVSPAILAIFRAMGKIDKTNVDPLVSAYVGKVMDMDVFCDVYSTTPEILMGYKGPTEMDAGIFYGIYKPVTARKMYGEESGNPRQIFRSRVGFKDNLFGVENYYRALVVENLPYMSM